MSDELLAAAEYCRDRDGYEFSTGPTADGDFIDKAKAVAEAYLAEHTPDDAEPVTAEWSRSVGFEQISPDMLTINGSSGDDLIYTKWPDSQAWGWEYWDAADRAVQLPPMPTRGDVRRLLAALGITPKP